MSPPDTLRTELPPAVRERLAEMEHDPRPHQIPIDESRRLRRESGRDSGAAGDDPRPVGAVKEFAIAGPADPVPLRIHVPEGQGPFPVVVWFHGGGFVRGGLDGNDALARYLATEVGASVVTVDYRLAPEHAFPAALLDCYAALEWVADNPAVVHGDPERVAVGGTSAGGNLAAATALLARDRLGAPEIAHQFLGMPMLDAACDTPAHEENATGYGLTTAGLRYYWDAYLAPTDRANAYACPARARDLSGLPPATVVTAGFDPLRDEGLAYADRLEAAGVDVDRSHYPGLPHHLSKFLREGIDPAVAAWAELADGLAETLAAD
jgi:acetyl esterase